MVFKPSCWQSAAKNLEVNWGLLSVSSADGISKLKSQFSMNMSAILTAVVFAVGICLVRLDYRFVITTMLLLPPSVFGKGLSMSIAIKSGGPDGRNGRSFLSSSFVWRFCVHDKHLATIVWKYLAIWVQ